MRRSMAVALATCIFVPALASDCEDRLAKILDKSKSVKGKYETAALSEEFGQLGTSAFAADEYGVAVKAFHYAVTVAKKHREPDMVELWETRLKRTVAVARAYKKIKKEPKDSSKRGDYYCLTKEDWKAGLPLLAGGNDDMAKAAKRELEEAVILSFVELGDIWVEVAKKLPKRRRGPVMRHAGSFYEKATASLKDDELIELEKRLAPLAEQLEWYARPSLKFTRTDLVGTYVDSLGRQFTFKDAFAWKFGGIDYFQAANARTDYGLEWTLDEKTQVVQFKNPHRPHGDAGMIMNGNEQLSFKVGVKRGRIYLYDAMIVRRAYIGTKEVKNLPIPLTMTKVK